MYITMDVIFHESTIYFANKFELHGEKQSGVTFEVTQHSNIDLETCGEILDLSGERQTVK